MMRVMILLLVCVPGSAGFPAHCPDIRSECRARTLDPRAGYPNPCSGTDWGSNTSVDDINWMSTGATVSQSSTQVPAGTSCPSSAPHAGIQKKGGTIPQSDLVDSARCSDLGSKFNLYNEHQDWQRVYDTGKALVETCYNNFLDVDGVFGDLGAAVQILSHTDTSIRREYHEWLESVLYLNTTDPAYFCRVVVNLAASFPDTVRDTSEQQSWRNTNKQIAILYWIIENTNCDTSHEIWGDIVSARETEKDEWLNDTLVPLDTTIPPLDSIEPGLKALLEKHFLYADVNPELNAPAILSNLSATPNPVSNGTVISFTMNKEAYVRITLFDVLGKQLGASAFESFFQPGNKSVPISLAGLPSGTYYARIQTAYGEVQTVKLVKE